MAIVVIGPRQNWETNLDERNHTQGRPVRALCDA